MRGDDRRGRGPRDGRKDGGAARGRYAQNDKGGTRGRDASQGRATERPRARAEAEPDPGLIWGRAPVLGLLEEMPSRVLKVFLSKTMQRGTFSRASDLCREHGVPFVTVEPRALDAMTCGENHQGVAAASSPTDMLDIDDALALMPPSPEAAAAVLFDHVMDVRNVGAMIRTAEAAGASFAALPMRRGALPNGAVVRTSAGASLRFPIASVGNTAAAVRSCKEAGLWCVGLEADGGRSIYEAVLPPRALLVVGGEGSGLSRTAAAECDEVLRIPITGSTGSLNASIALAVALFEWSRLNAQRKE